MSARSGDGEPAELCFGPFRLIPQRKLLLRDGRPVRLGQRSLDLLHALTRRAGEVIGKRTLMAEAWPDLHVDESNLRVQMTALRKALGDGVGEVRYVVTVAGRGYCFVAPVLGASRGGAAESQGRASRPLGALPVQLLPVIGRAADVANIVEILRAERFVTIIGAGGVGKTTVGVAVAAHLAASYDSPPVFVDFAALTDRAAVPDRLASALEISGDDPLAHLAAQRDVRRLVILDSCEPVVGAAAAMAEAVLRAAPGVHVLATSREPLRAEGEWTYRLPSLETPPSGSGLTAANALAFPAVQLFVERSRATARGSGLADADAPVVADICRRLDGIPLAIELAATHVAQLGITGLAERLDHRFTMLLKGRRTALPRHQTLGATLDWSHGLLTAAEQGLLHRLSVFRGWFTLDAALAVAAGTTVGDVEAIEQVARLVDKSFLVVSLENGPAVYRLLDVTRVYAAEKLAATGEAGAVAALHAAYICSVFVDSEGLWATLPPAEAKRRMVPHLDDLRAALEWAHGPEGAADTAVTLTAAAVPLWACLGLVEEARARVERALAAFRRSPQADPRRGMQLFAALGTISLQLGGTLEEAWRGCVAIAGQLGDVEYQLRGLNGLALSAMRRDYREALALATQFRDLAQASADPNDAAVGDRLVGYVLHSLGKQEEARRLTERMLASYARRSVPPHQARLNYYDQRVLSISTLARINWVQGFPSVLAALRHGAFGLSGCLPGRGSAAGGDDPRHPSGRAGPGAHLAALGRKLRRAGSDPARRTGRGRRDAARGARRGPARLLQRPHGGAARRLGRGPQPPREARGGAGGHRGRTRRRARHRRAVVRARVPPASRRGHAGAERGRRGAGGGSAVQRGRLHRGRARRPVLGIAGGDEPGRALAGYRARRGGTRTPRWDLATLRRGARLA
jgi:predicted ATPase/DNA-binding winged helix-turn-helix (wHTH) protein